MTVLLLDIAKNAVSHLVDPLGHGFQEPMDRATESDRVDNLFTTIIMRYSIKL
jgi:hypothetical protein